MLAVQDVEEADPNDILHCDSLHRAVRQRESFGIERRCGIIFACAITEGGCCSAFFSGPAFLNTPFEAGGADSAEARSTEQRGVEESIDLGGGDGGVWQHGPSHGRAQIRSEVRHRNRLCVCDDEISPPPKRDSTKSRAQSARPSDEARVPATWLPPELWTTPPEPAGAWAKCTNNKSPKPELHLGPRLVCLQRNQCALTCSLSCVDSWQNHELRSSTVSFLLFHPR